jgi:hypothetical protein
MGAINGLEERGNRIKEIGYKSQDQKTGIRIKVKGWT